MSTAAAAGTGVDDDVAEYRATARAWLLEHTEPKSDAGPYEALFWMVGREAEEARHHATGAMMRRLHAAGYASFTMPAEYGGQGGESWMQRVFAEESADREVNPGFYASIAAMAGPAILQFGTEAQKQAHLPGLLSGEVTWCQLFSEPGAGSDLAALGCRAVRDGDEFVITGQKVWNSAAMWADMGILLVRTDPTLPKHKGITFLMVDMSAPGVEVRPLVQANGAGHFAEVFFDEYRCGVDQVLGDVNAGWSPARVVMANESASIGGNKWDYPATLARLAAELGSADDPLVRQALADAHIRQRILGWTGQRLKESMRSGGRRPSPHPSVLKLFVAESRRLEGELAQRLLGPAGVADVHEASAWAMERLVNRFSVSIGGGTNEVHRNNLGEQALGLPRDPRADKDTPWAEIPKG